MDETSPKQVTEIRFGKIDGIKARLASAISAAREHLFSRQQPEGYWFGELEADTTLVSDYIFMHMLLGTVDEKRFAKCATQILRFQNEDGGWPIYNGGPSNISAAVKAYFALKMAGYTPDHPALTKAREWILSQGGVPSVNTFTKLYLCALGQYDYDAVPAIPPEIVLFSSRSPSATPRSRSKKFRITWRSTNCFRKAAIIPRCASSGTPRRFSA